MPNGYKVVATLADGTEIRQYDQEYEELAPSAAVSYGWPGQPSALPQEPNLPSLDAIEQYAASLYPDPMTSISSPNRVWGKNDQPVGDPSTYDNLRAAFAETVPSLVRTYGAAEDFISQTPVLNTLYGPLAAKIMEGTGIKDAASRMGSGALDMADKMQERIQSEVPVPEEGISRAMRLGIPMASTLAAATVAGGPLGALAPTGQMFANRYDYYKKEGVDPSTAGVASLAWTPVDYATSRLPGVFNSAGPIARYGIGTAVNAAANMAQEIPEMVVENKVLGIDITPEIAMRRIKDAGGVASAMHLGGTVAHDVKGTGAAIRQRREIANDVMPEVKKMRERMVRMVVDNTVDPRTLPQVSDEAPPIINESAEALRARLEAGDSWGTSTTVKEPANVTMKTLQEIVDATPKRGKRKTPTPAELERMWETKPTEIESTSAKTDPLAEQPLSPLETAVAKKVQKASARDANQPVDNTNTGIRKEATEANESAIANADTLRKQTEARQQQIMFKLEKQQQKLSPEASKRVGEETTRLLTDLSQTEPILATQAFRYAEHIPRPRTKQVERFIGYLKEQANDAIESGFLTRPEDAYKNPKAVRRAEQLTEYHELIERNLMATRQIDLGTKHTKQTSLTDLGRALESKATSLTIDMLAARMLENLDEAPTVKKLMRQSFNSGEFKRDKRKLAAKVADILRQEAENAITKIGIEDALSTLRQEKGALDITALRALAEGVENVATKTRTRIKDWDDERKGKSKGRKYIYDEWEVWKLGRRKNQVPQPGTDWIRAQMRDLFTLQITLSERNPVYKDAYYAKRKESLIAAETQTHGLVKMQPLYALDDADARGVNAALIALRYEPRFRPTPENLARLGLNEQQIRAVDATYDGMRYYLNTFGAALKRSRKLTGDAQAEWHATVDELISRMSVKNYVPFSRFGDWAVSWRDNTTGVKNVEFVDDLAGARKRYRQLKDQNVRTVSYGEIVRGDKANELPLPPEMLAELAKFDSHALESLAKDYGVNIEDFRKHIIGAKLVPGFNTDIRENILAYAREAGNYIGRAATRVEVADYKKQLGKISPVLEQKYSEMLEHTDSRTPTADLIKTVNVLMLMSGVIKTVTGNATSPITMTWPEATDIAGMKKGTKVATNAMDTTVVYGLRPSKIRAQDPQLFKALQKAEAREVTKNAAVKEMIGVNRWNNRGSKLRKGIEKTASAGMYPFGKVENINRTHAFITGWKLADESLPFEKRFQYATEFVWRTQGDYDKANDPKIFRSQLGQQSIQFKKYGAAWFRMLKHRVDKRTLSGVAAMLAATGLLGGLRGNPFGRMADDILKAADIDTDEELRKLVGNKAANVILDGAFNLVGINMSRSLDAFNYDFDQEDPMMSLGKVALGPTSAYLERLKRFASTVEQSKSLYRKVEAFPLMPEAMRAGMSGFRPLIDGGDWTSPSGEVLVPDVTPGEMIAKALGFSPSRLVQSYNKQELKRQIDEKIRRSRGHYNRQIGQEMAIGNDPSYLIDEALKKQMELPPGYGPELDFNAQREAFLDRLIQDRGFIKRMPKEAQPSIAERLKVYDD